MKRLAIVFATAVVLFAGLLMLAPQFIPADAARAKIAEQIEQWIGRPVSFSGEPSISFFPRPSVRLENVVIEDRDGSGTIFIQVDELIGTFRLLPLLIGRVQARSFELRRPTIALRVDEDGQSNWTFDGTLGERVAEAQENGGADLDVTEVALGTFRLIDGTLTFEEPGAELATLSEVTLDFTWSSTAVPAFASGSVIWRGERVAISATLTEPMELIAGRSSRGQFTVAGDPINITFDGAVGRNDLDLVFDGETRVEMDSLRRVVDWAGGLIAEGTTLADASIDGHARWEWPVLEFSDAEIMLDGNQGLGAFAVDFSGERIDIDGTLALRSLDLSGYADAFLSELQLAPDWRQAAIVLPFFDYVDMDVRISADRVNVGATHIEVVAASAIVSNGDILLRIGDAQFYGGSLRASLTAYYDAPLFHTDIQITVAAAEVSPALSDLVGTAPVTGAFDGGLSLSGEGTIWGDLIRNMTGEFDASITSGAIVGVDISRAAALRAPTIEAIEFGAGEMPFDSIEASFSIEGGQVLAERVSVNGPQFTVGFAGYGGLIEPTIGGQGEIVFDDGSDDARAFLFLVTGTWLSPQFEELNQIGNTETSR